MMRSPAPVPDCAERATQGGDSRWALSQAGPAPESARNFTAPPVPMAEGSTAPTDRPSGSSGHDLGDAHPATESARRRCPEQERRNPPRTESARRRRPDVGVPQKSLQRGHGEDLNECTVAGGLSSPPHSNAELSSAWTEGDTDTLREVCGDCDSSSFLMQRTGAQAKPERYDPKRTDRTLTMSRMQRTVT